MMSELDDFRRTIVYGEAALSHLRRNEIPAYPRNYELWYAYSSGFNHALNKAVNDVLRARGRITSAEVSKVYEQYVSPSRLSERIEEVGDKLTDEITAVMGLLDTSIETSSEYTHHLDTAKRELSDGTDPRSLKRIVEDLIGTTQKTEDTNRHLEAQLAESRRQIAELQESLEAIRYESLTDDLTTLANRRHFEHTIDRSLKEAEATGEMFSLIITDIDNFKKFNDSFGHQTGDQVLRLVAVALKQNIKGQDTACRYGGEEFAIILPRTNLRQAGVVADHIRKSVMSKELVKRSTGETLGQITISAGVSGWRRGDSVQSIIERADACVYAAKRAGRNVVKIEVDPDSELTSFVA